MPVSCPKNEQREEEYRPMGPGLEGKKRRQAKEEYVIPKAGRSWDHKKQSTFKEAAFFLMN